MISLDYCKICEEWKESKMHDFYDDKGNAICEDCYNLEVKNGN